MGLKTKQSGSFGCLFHGLLLVQMRCCDRTTFPEPSATMLFPFFLQKTQVQPVQNRKMNV